MSQKPQNHESVAPDSNNNIEKKLKLNITKKKEKYRKVPKKHDRTNEAPFYASFLKASYTLEAAIILPLFLTFMMFAAFLYQILKVESGMQQAIDMASRTMAVTGSEDNNACLAESIGYATLLMDEYDVPLGYVKGGKLGLNYASSKVDNEYLNLKVNYKIKFPIGLLGKFTYNITTQSKNRRWIGYTSSGNLADQEAVAYVSTYSEVYHLNRACTYLLPSVRAVSASEVKGLRNESRGKYYPCIFCKGNANSGTVYITDYGTSYHSDINCGSIKRNIRTISLEDAKALYPPCSKCAGE